MSEHIPHLYLNKIARRSKDEESYVNFVEWEKDGDLHLNLV